MIINPILKKTVVNNVESESIAVDLHMKNGDQVITPSAGKVLDKATVKKPATFQPENIKKGVTIAGVVGSYETPAEALAATSNGEYTPPVGKHFSKVTVNVEAADGGTSEDLTAELSEQDALLTEIEAMLEENGDSGSDSGGGSGGESAVLTVNFASEYEDWENSDGEMVYEPSDETGSYTVDGADTAYFEIVSSLEIPCAVGSVVEIIYAEWYEYGRSYRDAQGVDVERFYVDDEYGEQIACFRITVTESDASVTLYDIYG
ncbi:MAG: hypothetical protein IKC26_02030 [Clostridia bacterium]|nr:hypothetical protein [Clostridia bacterium]